jgi:hypothetical protein
MRRAKPMIGSSGSNSVPHDAAEVGLRLRVRRPDGCVGQLIGAHQHLGVVPPARKVLLEEGGEGRMHPGFGMNAVGNGADVVAREHGARRLGMALRHAVHVGAQVQRQARHVELLGAGVGLQLLDRDDLAGDMAEKIVAEPVVAGIDRGVGREDAEIAHAGRIGPVRVRRRQRRDLVAAEAAQELDREQRRVAFVHVVGLDFEAERVERAQAADAENDLLLQAVDLVAAIEKMRQVPVLFGVLLEIGVEE